MNDILVVEEKKALHISVLKSIERRMSRLINYHNQLTTDFIKNLDEKNIYRSNFLNIQRKKCQKIIEQNMIVYKGNTVVLPTE